MTSTNPTPGRAVIIGGGLAGMVAAKELLARDVPVLILEKSERLGGKAGADLAGGVYEEHGYHVFPTWYANTLALVEEIGASGSMIPIERFHYLVAPDAARGDGKGVFPDTIEFRQLDSLRAYVHNTFSGIVPWYEAVLSFYAIMDLCSQSWSRKRFLDRVSVNGFLRSRWYASDVLAEYHQQTVLQASAIPNYELSAMTMKNLVHHWAAEPSPLFRILDGNLQQKLIDPLERHIREQGAEIRMATGVERLVPENGRISALELETAGGRATEPLGERDVCVIATPLEVTAAFVDDTMFAAEETAAATAGDVASVSTVNHLESAPMAAFQFYLRRKVDGIPAEHVNLYGSRFGLSFIDVSQSWDEHAGERTVLSVIASDFESLKRLSDEAAAEHVLEELRRFVPVIEAGDVERVYPQVNVTVPLFLNTVGGWPFRPRTRTRLGNLYIAGDYCQTDADLTTMESAVMSARSTAADILRDKGLDAAKARPIPLRKLPRAVFWVPRWLLWPFAIGLRALVRLFA